MMKALAEKGYREAVRDYALLIKRGAVKGAARGDADKLLKAAADKGDAPSMVELGYKAQRARRTKEALQWYEKAAATGYARGAYAAAMVLPVVKPKNWRARTYSYLKKASDAGHVKAMEDLAGAILNRMFPGVSPARAVPFLKKAAARGSIKAKTGLANIYAKGIKGVKQDRKKAEILLNELAKGGQHKAWISLGDLAALQKNFHGAVVYYKKATAKGVFAGYRRLVRLEQGRKRPNAARAWMKAGSDAGDKLLGKWLLRHDFKNKNYRGLMESAAYIAKGNNPAGLRQVVSFYGSHSVSRVWPELRKYADRDMKVGGIGAARRVTEIYIGRRSLTWNTAIIEEQIRTLERIRKLYGSRNAKLAKRITDALPKRYKRLNQSRKEWRLRTNRRAQARAYLAMVGRGHRPVCGAPPTHLRNRPRNSEIKTWKRKLGAWENCVKRMRKRLDSERPKFTLLMFLEEKTPIGTNIVPLTQDDLARQKNKVRKAINADFDHLNKWQAEWIRRNR